MEPARLRETLSPGLEEALTCVAPPARAHLWRILGRIGLDDRPGVGVRNGVPDIAWIDIPDGPFRFGEDRRIVTLPAFRIARYPITNSQFEAFVIASERWDPLRIESQDLGPSH